MTNVDKTVNTSLPMRKLKNNAPINGKSQSTWATDPPKITQLHPSSPFITTHPKHWHLFYHPTKGRRLSQPDGQLHVNMVYYLRQGGYVFATLCLFVCLSVCQRDNSKRYGRIFLKFSGNVGNSKNYQWFNFGGDPEGILDSGLLWNFR